MACKATVIIVISTGGLNDADPSWIEEQRLERNLINGHWDWVEDTQHSDSKKNKTKDKRRGS